MTPRLPCRTNGAIVVMSLFGSRLYSKDRPMFPPDLFGNLVVERAGLTDFELLVEWESDENGLGDSVVALE